MLKSQFIGYLPWHRFKVSQVVTVIKRGHVIIHDLLTSVFAYQDNFLYFLLWNIPQIVFLSQKVDLTENSKCYVFFPTEGYGGNLNVEKNEKE